MTGPTPNPGRRPIGRLLSGLLALAGGLMVAVVGVLIVLLGGHTPAAYATTPASCTGTSAGDYTVSLTGLGSAAFPDLIGVDTQTGSLAIDPSTGSSYQGWADCTSPEGAPTTITFASTSSPAENVEFDESSSPQAAYVVSSTTYYYDGPPTACIGFAGPIAKNDNGTFIVKDEAGGAVQVGSNSISLGTVCGTSGGGLPSNVAALDLIGNGDDTISTGGVNGGTASSLPTTFTVGGADQAGTETIYVGDSAESTLDFSNAGQATTCTATTCRLFVNSSGAKQTTAPDGQTAFPAGPASSNADYAFLSVSGTVKQTYDFTASSSTGTTLPDVTNYDFSSSAGAFPAYLWAQGGTYTVPVLPAGSQFGVDSSSAATLGSSSAPTSAGTTGFYAGAGTETFYVDSSGSDTFDAGAGTDTFNVSGAGSDTYTAGAGTDTFNVSSGSNTFFAGAGTDYFYDSGTGNTVNFTDLTPNSGDQLQINASGAQQQDASGQELANGAATLGSTAPTYFFYDGSTKTTDADFTTFVGPSAGYTEFIAGNVGGLNFQGSGSSNSAVFDTSSGIVANLGSDLESGSTKLGSGASAVSYNVPAGQVLVSSSAPNCTLTPTSCDTLSDVYTFTGPAGGYSTFYSGNGGTPYTITGQGTASSGGNNTFYASIDANSAQVTFNGGGEGNTFYAGAGVETFNETTIVQNPTNTINFSLVVTSETQTTVTRLVINVSGQNTTVPDYVAGLVTSPLEGSGGTVSTTEVYTFGANGTQYGSQFKYLVGSDDGFTTFDAGSGEYDYEGNGSSTTIANGNVLDFSDVPSGTAPTLTLDSTSTPGQATLGGVPEQFSGIYDLIGLSTGDTTFVAGASGGYEFQGEGSGNSADYSSAAYINLTGQTVTATANSLTYTIGSNFALIGSPSSAVTCSASSFNGSCDQMSDIATIAVGNPNAAANAAGQSFTIYAGPSGETFSDVGSGQMDTDTLDFYYVSTSTQSPLTIDVSGGPNSGTATLGSSVAYTFTTGTDAFTQLIGPDTGNTSFLASGDAGYSYTAYESGDSISFAAATTGIEVTYATSPTSGTVNLDPGGTAADDTINGLTTVTGSSAGGNTFIAYSATDASTTTYDFTGNGNGNTFVGGYSGPEIFNSTGTDNTFTAGQSIETFNDSESGNTVDLSKITAQASVNVSGDVNPIGQVADYTADAGSYTYSFQSFGSGQITFLGSQGGTTFYAGSIPDTFEGYTGVTNTLSFEYAAGTVPDLVITVGDSLDCSSTDPASFGSAQNGSVTESFCGIANLDGLPGGDTSFIAAAGTSPVGGYDFVGYGSGNSVSFASSTTKIIANLSSVDITIGSTVVAPDSVYLGVSKRDGLTDIETVTGADADGNYFYAANGQNDTFLVPTGSVNNELDFTNVQTSSTSPLLVNLSGGPVGSNSQVNGTAQVTGGNVYTFTSTTGAFTAFVGAGNGDTVFYANAGNGTDTYTFTAADGTTGNSVNFSDVPYSVTVTVGGSSSPGLASTGTVRWGSSAVATINNLTSIVGSEFGGDTFTSGTLPSGTFNFTTTGGGNTFNVGGAGVTITDPGSSSSNQNTINFSAITSPLVLNVSGNSVGTTFSNDEAQANGSIYTFSNDPTVFEASNNSTTYIYAGDDGGDNFKGPSGPTTANTATLDFSNETTNSSLVVCTVVNTNDGCKSAGEILFGGVNEETFSNILAFVGLTSGSTVFVADNTDTGLSFTGDGGATTLDLSSAAGTLINPLTAVTINLFEAGTQGTDTDDVTFTKSSTSAAYDTIFGINTIIGSANVANTFVAGTSTETFKDSGTGHQDTVDFSNVPASGASPLTINLSTGSASGDGYTYTFGTGTTFAIFDGSAGGNTHFIAPKNTGGYTFNGASGTAGNTADFSANTVGVVVNLSPSTVTDPTVGGVGANEVNVDGSGSTLDTITGVQVVIGSPSAHNTFYGGLTGVEFESTSGSNTLSYFGLTTETVYLDEPTSTVYEQSAPDQPDSSVSDTYSLPGSLTFEGTPGDDTFRLGTTSTVIEGGGGVDALDLGSLDGVVVNLQTGHISANTGGGTISGITWSTACSMTNPNCTAASLLTVGTIYGSAGADLYEVGSTALDSGGQSLTITAESGSGSTLDLVNITDQSATVVMPVSAANGTVTGLASGSPADAITFTGINNLIGTGAGGDVVFVGTGTETLTEAAGNSGTLSLADLPTPTNSSVSYQGATISVTDNANVFTATITGNPGIGLSSSDAGATVATGFDVFIGTAGNDTFDQSGSSPSGGYTFEGEGGTNTVSFTGQPSGAVVAITYDSTCGAGADGTVTVNPGSSLLDTFSCASSITASGATFDVGAQVGTGTPITLNGGGAGTLSLLGASTGQGATINLETGSVAFAGTTTVEFSGMNAVDGTPYNDTFIDGSGTYTLNGEGGSDTISFAATGVIAAAEVNLSNNPYAIPTGYANAGSDLPGDTAEGGYGGTLTLIGFSNAIGTSVYNDLLIGADSGSGSLVGGQGDERFVLTGGFDYITTGSSASVLDLSQLGGPVELDLAVSGPQYFASGLGGVWILGGNIATVIAPSSGSTLLGGVGTETLQGGTGNDTLVAGSGTQTLVGGGGSDMLVGGSGNDTLEGGSQPVTFVPGSGTDTLTSATSGNTLDYQGAPGQVLVNLTGTGQSVPPGEEFANTTIGGNSASGGWGASVNLSQAGITDVMGNAGQDLFVVGSDDTVIGGTGNDLFVVDGGDNTLTAGNGTASTFLFIAGGPVNVISGGGDATVDFSQGTASVTVNLQSGIATGGFANNPSDDELTGILNIVGTPYSDKLIAGSSGATVNGDGAYLGCASTCGDLLEAAPSGYDILEAGSSPSVSENDDTFCANPICAVSGTNTGGGDTMIGGSGNDYFYADSGFGDSINGEGGYNYALIGPADNYTNINALL